MKPNATAGDRKRFVSRNLKAIFFFFYVKTLPTEDGSEDPVSEFLFENFPCCFMQIHKSKMTVAKTANDPPTAPTIAANEPPIYSSIRFSLGLKTGPSSSYLPQNEIINKPEKLEIERHLAADSLSTNIFPLMCNDKYQTTPYQNIQESCNTRICF